MKTIFNLLFAVLSFAALGAAGRVPATPMAQLSTTLSSWHSIITPFAAPAYRKVWIREEQSTDPNPGYNCGFSYGASYTCVDNLQSCTNTLLSNMHAYIYCSQVGAPSQWYSTTAYPYRSGMSSCNVDATCCPSSEPFVTTYLFTRDGYTATDFGCGKKSAVETWGANILALNPGSFSAALASLTADPTTSVSIPTPPTPPPITTTSQLASPTPAASGGMPLGEKIGVGVGVGIGVIGLGLALAAILLVRPLFVRQRHKGFAPPRYVEPERN